MAGPQVYDRVQETTATTGTGTYTLAGAAAGFRAFSVVGDGNTCYYAITDQVDWEVGLGTYTLAGTTLARTTVLASSNGGAAVSWAAGSKAIWLDAPALAFSGLVNSSTAFSPAVSDGHALGTTALQWSDLFGASGFVFNLANGDWVATHTTGILTVGTGDLRVTNAGTNSASVATVGGTQTLTAKTLTSPVLNTPTVGTSILPTANDGAALGAGATAFADLFLASGGLINWANGDAVITHSTGILTVSTGDLRVTTAGTNSASVVTVGGTQTLTSKTLTSPTLTTPAIGAATGTSLVLTGTSANELTAGRQGTTNPAFNVDASAGTSVTGLNVVAAAAAGRLALAVTSSGTDEGLSIDAKGAGTIRLGANSTGAIEHSRNAVPTASDGSALGTTSLMWADLFLASGGVINFNAGNYTITHSAGLLTTNGNLSLTTSGVLTTGTIELGAATDTTIARSGAGVITVEGSQVLTAKGQTLFWCLPAEQESPSANYATYGVRNGHPYLAFTSGGSLAFIVTKILPRQYSGNGLSVIVNYITASATTGTAQFTCAVEADAAGGQDLDSDGFATAQTATAATVPGTTGIIGAFTIPITSGANMDSAVAGDTIRLKFLRGTDTATGDLQIISVEMREAP